MWVVQNFGSSKLVGGWWLTYPSEKIVQFVNGVGMTSHIPFLWNIKNSMVPVTTNQ
jgi:hypothetical protein